MQSNRHTDTKFQYTVISVPQAIWTRDSTLYPTQIADPVTHNSN